MSEYRGMWKEAAGGARFTMIVPANVEHIAMLAPLRENESCVLQRTGKSIEEVLRTGIETSCEAWSAVVDGEAVACMWGFQQTNLLGGAHVWFVPTTIVSARPRQFLLMSREAMRDAVARYHYLYGFVDPKFEKSCRWMEWMGFRLTESEPYRRYEMTDGH